MRGWRLDWRAKRIGTQIILLVIVAVTIASALISAFFFWFPPHFPRDRDEAALATLARLIDSAQTPAAIAAAVDGAAIAFPRLHLAIATASSPPLMTPPDPTVRMLRQRLGTDLSAWRTEHVSTVADGVAIRLHDGQILTATLPRHDRSGPPPWRPPIITGLLVVLLIAVFSVWAARGVIAPLSRFADAAEQFDPDAPQTPLAERGPDEIRKASAAFNRMRERIKLMVENRTQMLAAIGHDLRTPITRLRLRAEFIADEGIRAPMLRDLDQMNAMVQAALSFLRTGQARPAATALHLPSLLKTVCDQFADTGANIAYEGPEQLILEGREDELQRAVTNFVQNGVKYGNQVVVRLGCSQAQARIDVEDDGPGIANAEKAEVLKPFMRGDAARTLDENSGFGLGLAIAQAIAKAHGGTLALLDRQPHGLTARLELPLAQAG